MKRQDLSLVALTFAPDGEFADLAEFALTRTDLELAVIREVEYYDLLQRDYGPIRWLAWLVVTLVAASGVFAGLNAMYASAMGRVGEWATLQTLGFGRTALLIGLVQEGVLLAATASLLAVGVAVASLRSTSVQFTMGAFDLAIDGPSVLLTCVIGLGLGVLGAIPPALRALKMPIVEGLKTV